MEALMEHEHKEAREKFIPAHPFTKLCAARLIVVVQQKGGNVIKGRAKWFRSGLLKLTEAEIIGNKHQVTVPWVLIEAHAIAHLHPETTSPEPVETQQ